MRSKSGTVRYVEAHHNFDRQDLVACRPETRSGRAAAGSLGVARSLTGRRWVWRDAEPRIGLGIAQRLGLPEIVGRLLAGARHRHRGRRRISSSPRLRALLPDPSVLADMDVAAERLARAAIRGETVAVFGDYDVDGACSAAMMLTLLRGLGCTVLNHVPDRMRRGLRPERPGAAVARAARRHAWSSASIAAPPPPRRCTAIARPGRRRGARPPQGGGPAAADRRDRQPEPARLRLRPGHRCAPPPSRS